jgi:hypothetical protein
MYFHLEMDPLVESLMKKQKDKKISIFVKILHILYHVELVLFGQLPIYDNHLLHKKIEINQID